MNKILPFILTLIFTIVFSVNSFALTLTDIGDLSITQQLSEFNYSQDNPTFQGTTTLPNTEVTVTTPNQEYITISDSAGYWSVDTISPMDSYNVTIETADLEYSFVLNVNYSDPMGNTATATTTTTQTPVPETGVNQVTSLFFTAGILLLAFYFYFWGSSSNTHKLEKYYLDN